MELQTFQIFNNSQIIVDIFFLPGCIVNASLPRTLCSSAKGETEFREIPPRCIAHRTEKENHNHHANYAKAVMPVICIRNSKACPINTNLRLWFGDRPFLLFTRRTQIGGFLLSHPNTRTLTCDYSMIPWRCISKSRDTPCTLILTCFLLSASVTGGTPDLRTCFRRERWQKTAIRPS